MIKAKNFIKRIGASIMATVCMVSTGSTFISPSTVDAADNPVYLTEMEGFPSTDTLIAKAAELLGKPYLLGGKGGNPYVTPYTVYSASNVTSVDCSGLIWWTMTSLGYKTHGFANAGSGENPVPIDTVHWLTHSSTPTITYGDKTCSVTFEKSVTSETEPVNWWTTGDGKTISPGSIVIADAAADHSWIYIGEFDNRDAVVDYLKGIGVDQSLLTSTNVRDWGTGSKHWRIESYAGGGVRVDNGIDAKGATTYRIQSVPISRGDKGTLTIEKYIDKAGKTEAQIASEANYTDYSKITFTLKNSKGKYVTATGSKGLYKASGTSDTAFSFNLTSGGKLQIKELNPGDYTLTETTNFDGLGLRTVGSQKVTVKAESKTTAAPYKLINEEKTGNLKVVKHSSNVLGKQDSTLNADVRSNAKFTIYDNTANLPMDTYTVKEYVDSSIFSADSDEKDVTTSDDGIVKVDFVNTELYGGFNIYKKTASMHNISGIQFRVYGKSYGGRDIDVRTDETDASGVVSMDGIPYGEYTIEECGDTVLDCFSVADGQTIVIDSPMEEIKPELAFMNEFYSGIINIKKETETGKSLAGFEFTIYAAEDIYEGALVEENLLYRKGEEIEVLVTDENGEASSCSILPFGYNYTVKETLAVAPYNCDAAPKTFTLVETETHDSVYKLIFEEEQAVETDGEETDKPENGDVDKKEETIDTKADTEAAPAESDETADDKPNNSDESLTDEPISVLTFVDTQQKAKLTIYKIDEKNEKVTLGGAEFDIIALEEIIVDKEVAFNEGDVITHVVTDEEGKAEAELWAGTRVGLKETKAPDGYTLAQDITEVDLAYNVDLLYTENEVSVKNAHQMGHFTIYKVDADNNRVTLGGAEFDIVAKNDITVSGDTHKAGDVIAHVVTDGDGKAYCELWAGYNYILRETKAPNGYQLATAETEITIDYNPDLLYTESSISVANKKNEIPKQPTTPKTGTAVPVAPAAGAGTLGLVALASAVMLKKKKD